MRRRPPGGAKATKQQVDGIIYATRGRGGAASRRLPYRCEALEPLMARQTNAQLSKTCESLRLEADVLADEVDGLRESLADSRARCRRAERLADEFEGAAIAAARERDDARDELEYAQETYEEDMAAFCDVYIHSVASLTSLVSTIGARLRAMAEEGGATPERLCALAAALADMPEGQLIALGSKTLATLPGREEPQRCIDCRGYGYARFAHSACLFGALRDGEPYAFNLACDRFEPWPAGPSKLALGPRDASTGTGAA